MKRSMLVALALCAFLAAVVPAAHAADPTPAPAAGATPAVRAAAPAPAAVGRAPGSSSAADAIMEADRRFSEVTGEKGLEGFLSFLAPEAVTLRPDQPIVKGREAVGELWKDLLANPEMAISWAPEMAEMSGAGDLGYTVGRFEVTRGKGEARSVVGTGRYLTIWRLQQDGSWKVVFDTGVQNTPPQAAKK